LGHAKIPKRSINFGTSVFSLQFFDFNETEEYAETFIIKVLCPLYFFHFLFCQRDLWTLNCAIYALTEEKKKERKKRMFFS